MIRPLRKFHRIIWIVIALLLPIGFVIAFMLSRKFEKFYNNSSIKKEQQVPNSTLHERFV